MNAEIDENDEMRRILLSIAGARIPGGCDDCIAHVVVHYGIVDETGWDMTQAADLDDGVFRMAVYHDSTCPEFAAGIARSG